MNETELEQYYAAVLEYPRTRLLAAFDENALAIAQAVTTWRKTLDLNDRRDANRLTRLVATADTFQHWVAATRPTSKAGTALKEKLTPTQGRALRRLLAHDALMDKHQVGLIVGHGEFADRATAGLVITAQMRAMARQIAYEALMHGQKTVLAIAADDPLTMEMRAELFASAFTERMAAVAAAWVVPALASTASALSL